LLRPPDASELKTPHFTVSNPFRIPIDWASRTFVNPDGARNEETEKTGPGAIFDNPEVAWVIDRDEETKNAPRGRRLEKLVKYSVKTKKAGMLDMPTFRSLPGLKSIFDNREVENSAGSSVTGR